MRASNHLSMRLRGLFLTRPGNCVRMFAGLYRSRVMLSCVYASECLQAFKEGESCLVMRNLLFTCFRSSITCRMLGSPSFFFPSFLCNCFRQMFGGRIVCRFLACHNYVLARWGNPNRHLVLFIRQNRLHTIQLKLIITCDKDNRPTRALLFFCLVTSLCVRLFSYLLSCVKLRDAVSWL